MNNNDAFYATKSEYSYHDEFFKKPVEGRTKSCDQAEEIQELDNIQVLRNKLKSKKTLKIKVKKGFNTFKQQDVTPKKVVNTGSDNLRQSLKLTNKKSS